MNWMCCAARWESMKGKQTQNIQWEFIDFYHAARAHSILKYFGKVSFVWNDLVVNHCAVNRAFRENDVVHQRLADFEAFATFWIGKWHSTRGIFNIFGVISRMNVAFSEINNAVADTAMKQQRQQQKHRWKHYKHSAHTHMHTSIHTLYQPFRTSHIKHLKASAVFR